MLLKCRNWHEIYISCVRFLCIKFFYSLGSLLIRLWVVWIYVCVCECFSFFFLSIFSSTVLLFGLRFFFFPRLFSVFFDSLALFSQLLLVFLLLPHMYRSYDVLYFRFAMYILNRAINFNISMLSWSLLVFRCALWIFNIFICATCS